MMTEKHYKVKFGFKPYEAQQQIIDTINGKLLNKNGEPYRFVIAILGRQSGKSWLARVTLLDRAINHKQNCMWVSQSYVASRTHWEELQRLIQESGLPTKKILQAAKEIHFYGGGKISVRTALAPDSMRGASLDYVVLDEAAFYEKGAYVWYSVVIPMVTVTRGTVFIPTTPRGRNWVYDLFMKGMGNDEYYKSFRWASYDSPYQDKKLLRELKRSIPSKQYKEEIEAEFLSDSGSVFSGLDEAAVLPLVASPVEGRKYVMGVDVGNNVDSTCITIMDKHMREQVYGERFSDIGTTSTLKRILELIEEWQPEKVVFEKNGVGEHLLRLMKEVLRHDEDAQDVVEKLALDTSLYYNDVPIKAVHMTNEIKRDFVDRLSADIEYGRVKVLSDQSEYGRTQLSEMGTYERTRTPAGHVTYAASGTNHDDTVVALYLAYSAIPRFGARKPQTNEQLDRLSSKRSPFKGGLGARHHRVRRHRKGG